VYVRCVSLPTLSSPESGPALGPDRTTSNFDIQFWVRATRVTFASGAISESKKTLQKIRHLFFFKKPWDRKPFTKNPALCIAHQPLAAARPSTFNHFHKSAIFLSSVCVVPRMSACDTPAKGERQGSGKQRDCIVCALIMKVGCCCVLCVCRRTSLHSIARVAFSWASSNASRRRCLYPPLPGVGSFHFFPF